MVNRVDRNTTLCISLAGRPSNHGVRFHNWLYAKLGLNFLYQAVAPTDIAAAVAGIRGLNIRGAGVSMPFKQELLPLLDALDASAERLGAVNTIVNDGDTLTGYNTDYLAVRKLLAQHEVDPGLQVAVRGSGGMAAAVVAALTDYGLRGTVVARNHVTGASLARRHDWDFSCTVPEGAQMLVNVTPLGMRGEDQDELAFSEAEILAAEVVFDCVADPFRTPLILEAERRNKVVIHGGEVIALQAAEQFALYTGVMPSAEEIEQAEQYAMAGM